MSRSQSPPTPTNMARTSRYSRLWNSKSLKNQLNREHVSAKQNQPQAKVIYIRIRDKIQKISIIYSSSSKMARLPGSGETLYQFLYGVGLSKSDRIAQFVADPDISQFSESTCMCRACGRTTRSEKSSELLWNWTYHRTKCIHLQALFAAEANDTGRQDTAPSPPKKNREATGNATTSKPRKTNKRRAPRSSRSPVPRKKTCLRPQLQSSDDEYVAAAAADDEDKDDDVYIDLTEYQREHHPGPSTLPRVNKSNRTKTKASIRRQTDAVPYNYFNQNCTPEAGYLMNAFFKP